jgi:protein-S-isoprenylcysteine O-methyltransferase Ste14
MIVTRVGARLVAWIGGALFVGSLALTAWWYFVRLGRPRPGVEPGAVVVDALLIAFFALHHSVCARESVKRLVTAIPAPMMRSFYVWIASILLIVVVLFWRPIGGVVYSVDGPRAFLHAALQALGLGLIARAVAGLDALELAGIRQARGDAAKIEPLQIGGPYRLVRHPLYLGWVLALFGAARMTGDRLAFAAMTTIYLVLAVPWEERSLMRTFGDDYARYKARVRWRIVPFIY